MEKEQQGQGQGPQQWTYVYWDATTFYVYRQVPDPLLPEGRVISTEIARGTHQRAVPQGANYYQEYAEVQVEIGQPHATAEWPLKTCTGSLVITGIMRPASEGQEPPAAAPGLQLVSEAAPATQNFAFRVKREGAWRVPQWRFTDESYIHWRDIEDDEGARIKCETHAEAQVYVEQKKREWAQF